MKSTRIPPSHSHGRYSPYHAAYNPPPLPPPPHYSPHYAYPPPAYPHAYPSHAYPPPPAYHHHPPAYSHYPPMPAYPPHRPPAYSHYPPPPPLLVPPHPSYPVSSSVSHDPHDPFDPYVKGTPSVHEEAAFHLDKVLRRATEINRLNLKKCFRDHSTIRALILQTFKYLDQIEKV